MPQAGSDYLPVEARIENDTSLTVCSILWLESSQARIEMPHIYEYNRVTIHYLAHLPHIFITSFEYIFMFLSI